MAQSQDISVARAVFISALLRSENNAPEISREDATLFAKTLLKTCNICTTSNIKLCKSFITKYILPSGARITTLSKYLIILSKSCHPREPDVKVDTTYTGDESEGLGNIVNGKFQQPPEPAFRRLHVLYIVHDVLVHIRNHLSNDPRLARKPQASAELEQLQPVTGTLAELAACGSRGKAAPTIAQVLDLLAFWKSSQIFTANQVDQIQQRVSSAEETDWDSLLKRVAADNADKAGQRTEDGEDDADWTLPYRHSVVNDPSAPWHELPAANGLYMKRTRGYPLRAMAFEQGGYKLQNGGEEADPQLQADVENLYNEVLRCYNKFTNGDEVQDIDALGNIIWKDPERPTRNCWGFTVDGIDRRKELAEGFADSATWYEDVDEAARANDAVERARMLAAERGRGMGRGRGGGRGGWRGGRW